MTALRLQCAGFLFVLGGCFCSGFAVSRLANVSTMHGLQAATSCHEAVYLEKLVKQAGKAVKTSMWVQNMQLVPGQMLSSSSVSGEGQQLQCSRSFV